MAGKSGMGRPSIFGDKVKRIQGQITIEALKRINVARARLAELSGWKVKAISDGDTLEFLARGEAATIEYLEAKKRDSK